MLSISLCLSSLHALILYTLAHHTPSSCCAIHPCHLILSALHPVCCCIFTAYCFLPCSLFMIVSPCTLVTSWTHFPSLILPHAPHVIAIAIMQIYTCCFFCHAFFSIYTCPVSATHFSDVCHSSHAFYLLYASYPFTYFSIIFLFLCLSP